MPTRAPTHRTLPRITQVYVAPGSEPVKRVTGRTLQCRRMAAWIDANATCADCGCVVPMAGYELDHVVPLHKGGADDASNLQVLCKACHARKTDADLNRRHAPRIGADGCPVGG